MAAVIQSKNFESCCRTCLKTNSQIMFDLFDETTNVAGILTLCTSIKVDKKDCLPQCLCDNCYNCLVSFFKFRKLAEEIDKKLRLQLNESIDSENFKSEDILIDIKIENEYPEDYICYSNSECDTPEKELKAEFPNREIDNVDIQEQYLSDVKLEKYSFTQLKDCNNKDSRQYELKCEICDKEFKKLSKLKRHKAIHRSDKLFTCEYCTEQFRHRSKFLKHLVTHETRPYISETNQNETNQSFECDICKAIFKSMPSLSAHMRKHCEKGRILSCSLCGKIFKKVSHLKRHELCHDDNRPYKCTICPKSFTSDNILKEHLNKHNGVKPHACPVCAKAFSHLSTLNNHIKVHTKEKPFLCPTCGKRFDSSTNLKQHMNRHVGLKLFACNLCPKRFVSKGELKSHSITHTGERAYTCDQCGATFTTRCSLGKHKLRHLGIKPHQCDACSMKFTSKDHLKRHHRIHTGEKPFRCDICERAFTQSNDLVKHQRAHLGDKLYKCIQCTESFRLKTELRQHISEHFISSQLHVNEVNEPSEENIDINKSHNVEVEQDLLNNRIIQNDDLIMEGSKEK